MNILPKKSWHVRNRDNIVRVKRDEAQAAEEEKQKEARIALAEQEARTEILRTKARSRGGAGSSYDTPHQQAPTVIPADVPIDQPTPRHHINFFSELESGSKVSGANKDHEAEKKKEQEDYEKKIGLLTYLGQSSLESQTVKPWYQQARGKDQDKTQAELDKHDVKRKAALDPMHDMMRYLGKKPKTKTETKTAIQSQAPTSQVKGGLPGTTSLLSMFSKYKANSQIEEDITKDTLKKYKEKKRIKERKSHKHSKKQHRSKKKRKHKHRARDGEYDSSDSESNESNTSELPYLKNSRKEKKKQKKHRRRKSSDESDTDGESDGSDTPSPPRSHHKKSSHRKKKRRHKSSGKKSLSNSGSSGSDSEESGDAQTEQKPKPGPTIEELRAERLRREAKEKAKTQRLLSGKPLEEKASTEPQITDKLDGKYNSQFNPHLARKHQPKMPLF